LLRFTTAGSVDVGKSTLIGRLLYDSKAVFMDQLAEVEQASLKRGREDIDLALITDGLKAEREQGITIDVAYRYFQTPKRKFIIADTPGHIEYTRNMVTGASTANAAIILVDATEGITEQTIRHAYIASLLCIPHVMVCINKMDLVDFSEEIFVSIQKRFKSFAVNLNVQDVRFIPISALHGDNIVERSARMNWYEGPVLMYLLESLYIGNDLNLVDARFPVQGVIHHRNEQGVDFRAFTGRVASGTFSVGDRVKVLPTGLTTTIESIFLQSKNFDSVSAPQSAAIKVTDDIDISRGCMIVPEENGIISSAEITLMVCWLSPNPMDLLGRFIVKQSTNEAKCVIHGIKYKIDINTLEKDYDVNSLKMNEIACITIRTSKPLHYDPYRKNRVIGSLILIDEVTNETVGAGMIE
jgi:sulfate adenylyltransferase subunit 1